MLNLYNCTRYSNKTSQTHWQIRQVTQKDSKDKCEKKDRLDLCIEVRKYDLRIRLRQVSHIIH